MRESFVLYTNYEEKLSELTDEELGYLLRKIFEYQKTGKIPKMKRDILMVFKMIQVDLDKNNERWEETKKARKIAGKKGGEMKKANATKRKQMLANASKCYQNLANLPVYVNVNDNVYVNGNNSSSNSNNNIYEFAENEFGRTLSPTEIETLDEWIKDFNIELVKEAIKVSVINCKRTFSYVRGILNNWKSNNIKSVNDLQKTKKEEKPVELPKELEDYNWFEDENAE